MVTQPNPTHFSVSRAAMAWRSRTRDYIKKRNQLHAGRGSRGGAAQGGWEQVGMHHRAASCAAVRAEQLGGRTDRRLLSALAGEWVSRRDGREGASWHWPETPAAGLLGRRCVHASRR